MDYLGVIENKWVLTTKKGLEYLGLKPSRDDIREMIVKATSEDGNFNSKEFALKHKLDKGLVSDITRGLIADNVIGKVQITGGGDVIAEINENTDKVFQDLNLLKDRTALINITNNFGDNTQIVTGNQSSTISLANHPTKNDNGSATNMSANTDSSKWTRQNILTLISIFVVIVCSIIGWVLYNLFN